MSYISKASQPLGSTVRGDDGIDYLDGVAAISGRPSGASGTHQDKAGRTWLTEAQKNRANVNIDRGQSWRGDAL